MLRNAAACAALSVSALWALLFLAACSRRGAVTPANYLQVDIETSPTSLDPRFATDAISSRVNELTFDSLVAIDAHGAFRGELAEAVERPAPTVLVFHLRRGVRFADGRRLTARDVKFTYDSTLDPRSLSPKRAALAPLKSIEATGDYTVTMTTRAPYAPALAMATLGIVPAGTPAAPAAGGALTPGSGPFEFVSYARDDRVVLRRNPYRPSPRRGVRGIVFKVVPDPTVRALELTKGVCDLAENNIQPELLGYLERKPWLAIVKSPGTAYQYLAFNFRDRRLADLRVRRAIAYAIDRQRIVGSFLRGTARVASGMLSPENWAYDGDVTTYPYDPVRARRLLDEAGFAAGADGMRRGLSFVYKTTPEGARLGELIQAMLRRVGIRLKVRTNEWATFYGDIQRGNFDMTSMQWVGIDDPHQYYMVFDSKMTPPRGFNRGYYANPEMDRLVEAGDAALDRQARRRIYGAVQELAAADLPYVSLWWQDNVVVMNRALDGFRPYPNGSLLSLTSLTLAPPRAAEPPE
jgi:peptide/nickel transport system substrate-binding protein